MALNVPVFFTRLASSVVFVAVMLTGLLWNEWSFLALVTLINLLCIREYTRLMKNIYKDTRFPVWLTVAFALLGLALLLYASSLWAIGSAGEGKPGLFYVYIVMYAHMTYTIFLLPFVPLLLLLAGMMGKPPFNRSVYRGMAGLLYITVPMFFLFCMYKTNSYIPLVLLCLIWSNDTMAYLYGSFFGKTPLSPISPKKTWEGTIGGAVITVVAAAVAGYFIPGFHIVDWVALALCATIAGTFGDLLESKLKRMADVKDSGMMMPGHGGALDRFDSLLVATPFAFIYVVYFMHGL